MSVAARQRVGCKRMVTFQVTSKSLGQSPSMGSCLCTGKNSRASHGKVKIGLFREKYTPQSVGHFRRQERHRRPERPMGKGLPLINYTLFHKMYFLAFISCLFLQW